MDISERKPREDRIWRKAMQTDRTLIPVEFIDTDTPVKTQKTVFDEKPLINKGFPSLPSCSKESPYLKTIGVPKEWDKMVTDALFDGSRTYTEPVFKRFFLSGGLRWQTMHLIIYLVRTRKTSCCYNTQGALTKIDETLKPNENCKWLINSLYRELLKLIAKCTGDKLESILNMDLSMRYKRSKRDSTSTVTLLPEVRSFCFVSFIDDAGQTAWHWVDISFSNDTPQSSLAKPTPHYAGPQCHGPNCTIKSNLMSCVRCKSVFYCNKECQKKDWPSHKVHCIAK